MRLETTESGAVKRFRRMAATFFQRTFSKSSGHGANLARALVPDDAEVAKSSVVVETVVFEPKRLHDLLATHRLPLRYDEISYHHHAECAIVAEGAAESRALLTAALTDGIDFYFVPQPRQFLLYADHDGLATLFAARKGSLSRLGALVSDQDVEEVRDFHRWAEG